MANQKVNLGKELTDSELMDMIGGFNVTNQAPVVVGSTALPLYGITAKPTPPPPQQPLYGIKVTPPNA